MIKFNLLALLISLSIILATWFFCDWFFKDERDSDEKVVASFNTKYDIYNGVLVQKSSCYYWYDGNIIGEEYFRGISNIDSLQKECDKRADNYTKLIKNEPTN